MERIILLAGGNSLEHEISLLTMRQVYNAIDKSKYEVMMVYLSKDNLFFLLDNSEYKCLDDYMKKPIKLFKEKNHQYFKYKFKKFYFDYVFLLVHGKGMEDGTIQGYLDFLDIPCVSNNLLASAVGMDKYLVKQIAKHHSINVIDGQLINVNNYNYEKLDKKLKDYPYIFKANSLGSSIGVVKVNNNSDMIDAIDLVATYDDYLLIEKCLVKFKEYNLALFKKHDEFIVSMIEEINYQNILTYDDKYSNNGLENLKRIINPDIDIKLKNKIINNSKKIYDLLKCDSLVRVDFLYDEENNELYFNEINMIPGSIAFYLFEEKDILFNELIDHLIDVAKRNRYLKINKVNVLGDNVLKGLIKNIKK